MRVNWPSTAVLGVGIIDPKGAGSNARLEAATSDPWGGRPVALGSRGGRYYHYPSGSTYFGYARRDTTGIRHRTH